MKCSIKAILILLHISPVFAFVPRSRLTQTSLTSRSNRKSSVFLSNDATSPNGTPPSSKEQDLELTRQIILNHISNVDETTETRSFGVITDEASDLKRRLIEAIPNRPFGAPATNITTPPSIVSLINDMASELEPLTPYPPLLNSTTALSLLSGDWQLIYSDASEITRLIDLPFGFRLGRVFQPINVQSSKFENQALVKHRFLLFSGHTRVMANFQLTNASSVGETNRAGNVVNEGSRIFVKFQKVIFSLRRFLFIPVFGKIRKTAIPKGPAEQKGVVPTLDITYLDEELRISRGGDGSLFILVKQSDDEGKKGLLRRWWRNGRKAMKMLDVDAADVKVEEGAKTYDASVDILPGGGKGKDSV